MLYKGDTLYLNWLEDGIAELVFDAPGSVNKLDTATVASLGQALDVLEKQTELKGLLLRSNRATHRAALRAVLGDERAVAHADPERRG